MKHLKSSTILLLCAAAAPLCADAQGTQSMSDNKLTDQQRYMQEINKITPTAEPAVTRCADPFLTADFIWWRPQQDGLEYAFNGTSDGSVDADKGRLHRPHFEYQPGFKVGAGLKFRHDGWDIFAQYTWLRSDEDDSRSSVHSDADGDSNVQSNIFIPDSLGGLETFWADEAKANWSLHFNVLDLELGRNFWISKWLTLRPFVGMKFSWNDQKYNVEYEGAEFEEFNPSNVKLHMKLDQTSVGLRTGLNTNWYMWKNWAIFGEFAVSGIWNDFDSSRKDHVATATSEVTLNHINRDVHNVSAVIEWALGLRFETAFHKDAYMFMLQAGWEEQVWFDQNQFVMFPNQTPANLNFEGLTVKAGFYF
jgi:hypothetical protein